MAKDEPRVISLKCPECNHGFEPKTVHDRPTTFQCPECGAKVREGWDEDSQ